MFKIKALTAAVLSVAMVSGAHAFSSGGGSSASKMIIGDSIFALSGDIHSYLEDDLNETISTYARSGCQVLGGNLICSSRYSIPRQWSSSSKSGMKTVIMNGGGNDFLLGDGGDCRTEACIDGVLADIEASLANVYSDMRAKGIQQIVYLGYYNTPADANNVAINTKSMAYKIANYPAQGVDFVDARPSFAGNEYRYIGSDDIHPTASGSRVLATLIRNALD